MHMVLIFVPAFSEPQSHWPRVSSTPGLGRSGREARAGGFAPRGNALQSGRVRGEDSAPSLQPRPPEDKNQVLPSRHRPARCGNPNPTGQSLIIWGAYTERNTGRRGPRPRCRNPRITTTDTPKMKTGASGSAPPRKMWKTHSISI